MLKDKSVDIQDEAAEYLTFIDRKRQNRQSRITAVNDQQQVYVFFIQKYVYSYILFIGNIVITFAKYKSSIVFKIQNLYEQNTYSINWCFRFKYIF